MGEDSFFSTPAGLGVIAVAAGFGLVALAKVYGLIFMRWKTPFRVGETMNVKRATVIDWNGDEGRVSAGGEIWRATSTDALAPGDDVTVTAVDGLLLEVKRK